MRQSKAEELGDAAAAALPPPPPPPRDASVAAAEVALTLETQSAGLRPQLRQSGVEKLRSEIEAAAVKLKAFQNSADALRQRSGEKAYGKIVQTRCGGDKMLERVMYIF